MNIRSFCPCGRRPIHTRRVEAWKLAVLRSQTPCSTSQALPSYWEQGEGHGRTYILISRGFPERLLSVMVRV